MAKDLIHSAVKCALKKDDWKILADPYRLDYRNFILKADLAVEKPSNADKTMIRIIVEVKSFAGNSFVRELQQALGQYTMYLDAIAMNELEFELYLGISDEAYNSYFSQSGAQFAVAKYRLKLLVVDIERKEIVRWIQ